MLGLDIKEDSVLNVMRTDGIKTGVSVGHFEAFVKHDILIYGNAWIMQTGNEFTLINPINLKIVKT